MGKGSEVNLSNQVRGAEITGEEARVGAVEDDSGIQCPPVVGADAASVARVSLFQSMLCQRLVRKERLMDSNFV